MTKEQLMGIVRHSLTFLGGILLAYGIIDEVVLPQIIGAGTTLSGIIWSIVNKQPISLEPAIAVEEVTPIKAKKKRYYPKKKKEKAA